MIELRQDFKDLLFTIKLSILFYVPIRVLIKLLNMSYMFFHVSFLDLASDEEMCHEEKSASVLFQGWKTQCIHPDRTRTLSISGQSYSSRPTLSKLITWKECWRRSLKTKKSEGENLMYLRTKAAINLPILGI